MCENGLEFCGFAKRDVLRGAKRLNTEIRQVQLNYNDDILASRLFADVLHLKGWKKRIIFESRVRKPCC